MVIPARQTKSDHVSMSTPDGCDPSWIKDYVTPRSQWHMPKGTSEGYLSPSYDIDVHKSKYSIIDYMSTILYWGDMLTIKTALAESLNIPEGSQDKDSLKVLTELPRSQSMKVLALL
ncbi:hypothetical protein Tco_1425048, partial [Tanacetum coccineum]